MTQFLDDVLAAVEIAGGKDAVQSGRKGMKWGQNIFTSGAKAKGSQSTEVQLKAKAGSKIKTTGGKGQKASSDAVKAAVTKQVAKKSSTDALSNNDLQELVKRMQLESNFRRLAAEDRTAGQKFISNFLTNPKNRADYLKAGNSAYEALVAAQVGNDIKKIKL